MKKLRLSLFTEFVLESTSELLLWKPWKQQNERHSLVVQQSQNLNRIEKFVQKHAIKLPLLCGAYRCLVSLHLLLTFHHWHWKCLQSLKMKIYAHFKAQISSETAPVTRLTMHWSRRRWVNWNKLARCDEISNRKTDWRHTLHITYCSKLKQLVHCF